MEFRHFGSLRVIENDVDVHRIRAMALAAGFANLWISLPAMQAPIVDLDQFDRVIRGQPSHRDTRIVM